MLSASHNGWVLMHHERRSGDRGRRWDEKQQVEAPFLSSLTCGVLQDGVSGLSHVWTRRHPLFERHVGARAPRRLQVRREGDQQAVALQVGGATLESRVPRLYLRPAAQIVTVNRGRGALYQRHGVTCRDNKAT